MKGEDQEAEGEDDDVMMMMDIKWMRKRGMKKKRNARDKTIREIISHSEITKENGEKKDTKNSPVDWPTKSQNYLQTSNYLAL